MAVPGATVNQDCEGVPTFQVRPSPPVLVMVIVLDGGLLLAVVVNASLVLLSFMAGGEMLMVMGMHIIQILNKLYV